MYLRCPLQLNDFVGFYDVPICFWSCSHGMVCFVFGAVLMVWYALFLELFSWYGIFCFWRCSHGMVCFVFGAVLKVCYVLFLELFSWYDKL